MFSEKPFALPFTAALASRIKVALQFLEACPYT